MNYKYTDKGKTVYNAHYQLLKASKGCLTRIRNLCFSLLEGLRQPY